MNQKSKANRKARRADLNQINLGDYECHWREEFDKIIPNFKAQLKWPIIIEEDKAHCPLRIACNAAKKIHTVFVPAGKDMATAAMKRHMLHEYCHAFLTETYGPLFGSTCPTTCNGVEISVLETDVSLMQSACNIADDWFADYVLRSQCREYFDNHMMDLYVLTKTRWSSNPDDPIWCNPTMPLQLAWFVAEAHLYLGQPIFGSHATKDMIQVLLRHHPGCVSGQNKLFLWNDLLHVVVPQYAGKFTLDPIREDDKLENILLSDGTFDHRVIND